MKPLRDWNEFWFQPRDLTPLGLYRIAIGLVVLMKLALLLPMLEHGYSEQGIFTWAESLQIVKPPRICLFDFLPLDAAPVVFVVVIAATVLFTFGLWTRAMTIVVYLGLSSIDNRCLGFIHIGDRLLLVLMFFSMFAPLGATWSLDRLVALAQGRAQPGPVRGPMWAVRLMQFQVCLMYFWAFYHKVQTPTWRQGEAMYWVFRDLEWGRWPFPAFVTDQMLAINVFTYYSLAVEGLFPFLIWFARTRPYVLIAGVLLHLGMEYALTLQIYQYVVLASYLLFLDGERLRHGWRTLRNRWIPSPPTPVFFDGECGFCSRSVRVLQAIDLFKRLEVVDFRSEAARQRAPDLDVRRAERELLVRDHRGHWHGGFFAYRWMAWRLPLLWPIAPLLYLPGAAWLGTRTYQWIAAHRSSLSCPIPPR